MSILFNIEGFLEKLPYFRMPPASDHEVCRSRVCCLCQNLRGKKASRQVSTVEAEQVKQLRPGFDPASPYFASGICLRCLYLLSEQRRGREPSFMLPTEYTVSMPRALRSAEAAAAACTCRFCYLAKLSGRAFQQWQREVQGVVRPEVTCMCSDCFLPVVVGGRHQCTTTTQEVVANLTKSLPEEVQQKLVQQYLARAAGAAGDSGGGGRSTTPVLLTPATGGWPVPVVYGKAPSTPSLVPLSVKEAIQIGNQNRLSSQQLENVMADLRSKHGRNFIEPGLAEASKEHNQLYVDYFTAEEITLKDSKGNDINKTLFYCHRLTEFLQAVCNNRGIRLEDQVKISTSFS